MNRSLVMTVISSVLAAGYARERPLQDPSQWTGHADGGNAPAVTAVETAGRQALRLQYRDAEPHWGNVHRSVSVPSTATGLRMALTVNAAAPGAALYVWLFEADRDGYLVRVRPGNQELPACIGQQHEVTIPFTAFAFQPRGPGTRQFLSIDSMLLGCNYADFDITVESLTFVGESLEARPLPRAASTAAREGRAGTVALLDEPTFPGERGHSDPARLEAQLRRAGFGVTRLRAGDVCNPAVLTKDTFDVLVVPCAPYYPEAGADALRAYLRGGGAFFSTGGYAFDQLLALTREGWHRDPPGVQAKDMDRQQEADWGLNTRYGKPGDTMQVKPDQIGVFDPSYLLAHVTEIGPSAGQHVTGESWRVAASVEGPAAVAMTGSNSPVFPDVHGRWIPLVEGTDRFGRSRGPVGALVHNARGPYAGAGWAFFGVTNRDLFDGSIPHMDRVLVNTVRRLVAPTFLFALASDRVHCRPGESVTLSAEVHAPEQEGQLSVRFEANGRTIGDTAVVPEQAAQLIWLPQPAEQPFHHIRALLLRDGDPVDEMETGICIADSDVLARGPSIGLSDNYLQFRGRPTFLTGVNTTGMMWYSLSEDPLVWKRDVEQMNDYAQNMLRILHFSPFAKEKDHYRPPRGPLTLRGRPDRTQRQTDAIVQLAQRHNVIVFLVMHDWMPVELTDRELAAQREWNEFWCRRYRDVPGFMVDIQNEPSVRLTDTPHLKALAESWLSERYGSVDEARAAWQAAGSDDGLALTAGAERWSDLRGHDLDLFRTVLFDRWTKGNVAGIRAGAPDRLVTVGHLPTLTASDKILGSRNLDFTNTHYYGSIMGYRSTLKMIDRRFEGKGLSVGEFGSRIAHDHRTHGGWGDPADASIEHYMASGHYALGMGASFVANWSWKDFRDSIFPWGITHADLVPKPVLKAYRNMALTFRPVQPAYRTPELFLVLPDSHRFGYRSRQIHAGLQRAIDWLFDAHVPFGVINEWSLQALPKEAACLVWPIPYCPDDAAFDRVAAFVEAGGSLLLTGDVRFGPRRQADRLDRLARLGLPKARPPAEPFSAAARELPQVLRRGGTGDGQVFWCPHPVELTGGNGRALYRQFVAASGVGSLRVDAGGASVHAFDVPTVDGQGLAVINLSDTPATVRVTQSGIGKPVTMALAAERCGFLLVNESGDVIVAEAQGPLSLGDRRILADGDIAAVSLNGDDIGESTAVLVLPCGAGPVHLPRTGDAALTGEIGEFRGGAWTRLDQDALRQDGGLHFDIDAASALDLRLLAAPGHRDSAVSAVEQLLHGG